jgi:DNA-binding transcriptional LysR family regulator
MMIYYSYHLSGGILELHQLECFLMVVECGSFRAASEKLHKAQSAVSIAVKTLEENPHVKSFLLQNRHLENYGQFLKQGYESRIVLGVSYIFPQSELVPLVQNFILQFPFTEIIIMPETLSADELLENEKIDLSLGEVFNEKQLFDVKPLGHLRMLQVCASTHPLAKLRGLATKQELMKHRQVVLKSTDQIADRTAGVEPGQPQIGVQDFAMKKELLLRGVGWGSMPFHMVEAELKRKRMVTTSKLEMDVPILLAWSKKRALGPCAQFLISALSAKKMKL